MLDKNERHDQHYFAIYSHLLLCSGCISSFTFQTSANILLLTFRILELVFKMNRAKDYVDIYDYVVIGGGNSGAVAARRLAEDKRNYSVCLLEAGPRYICLDMFLFSNSE